MDNQTNFIIMELLRTALRLWDITRTLELGEDFEDAYPGALDYVNDLNDEDVIIAMRDALDELQKWASDKDAESLE